MTAVPSTLSVTPEEIPAELRELPQWVCWRWLKRKESETWTKPPVDPKTGGFAKPNDPGSWSTFAAAWQLYEAGGQVDGIGLMFTDGGGLVGVDLDHCRDAESGVVAPWAASMLAGLDTYAEISPSGTGLKAICRATLPDGKNGTNKPGGWPVEVYGAGRYFTMTGQRLVWARSEIRDAQPAIDALWQQIHDGPPPWLDGQNAQGRRAGQAEPGQAATPSQGAKTGRQKTAGAHRAAQAGLDGSEMGKDTAKGPNARSRGAGGFGDDDLLALVRRSAQGAKFDRLMAGDGSGYGSPSQADIALCNLLAFYTDDAAQIDRIFRQSGLYAGEGRAVKWDAAHDAGGRTYGEMTIDDALAYVRSGGKVYDPAWRSAGAGDGHREGGDEAPPALPPGLADPIPWLPLPEIVEAYHRAEMGDAELLAALYRGRIVYDHAEKAWHVWGGHSWERDRLGQVENLPGRSIASQYMYAAAEVAKSASSQAEQERVKELNRRAFALRTRTRRNNVLDMASTQPGLAIGGEEWDTQPWLLAVKNGVIDLRTGEIRPGAPADYLRTVAPTQWQGIDTPAPRWERFLTEVFDGDGELVAFLQRLLGHGITGLSTEAVFPILWGKGRNGKDTLLNALAYALGPGFADAVPDEVFIDAGRTNGGAATPHIYRLRGLRLAWASETEEGARLKLGQVKLITGGGVITARNMYTNLVSWAPTHTLMLITNHRPHMSGDDKAIWARVKLIPFTLSFVDDPKEPNERRRDPDLAAKLQSEAPGILAWLVRGCLAWQQEGLRPPASVQAATAEYRSDEDTLGLWLSECCIVGDGYTCKAMAAYQSYSSWCETMKVRPMSGTAFGKKMGGRHAKETTRTGVIYRGMGLLSDATP